jgi:hypothetical protein
MGEMLGFDNVNNAFGFVLMFYGLASFIGIPLAGTLLSLSNYDIGWEGTRRLE